MIEAKWAKSGPNYLSKDRTEILVYADWLEEQGQVPEAVMMRLAHQFELRPQGRHQMWYWYDITDGHCWCGYSHIPETLHASVPCPSAYGNHRTIHASFLGLQKAASSIVRVHGIEFLIKLFPKELLC